MNLKESLKIPYRWLMRRKQTYSQTGEDIIADFFLSDIKKGFYVDVGANDPIYLNNTYHFYKKGWRGLLIEPDAFRCRVLKTVRPGDKVLNMGVGENRSQMDFYAFKQDTYSTFSKTEAEDYKKIGYQLKAVVPVPVEPLKDIFFKYAKDAPIDLLSVDTEGWDFEALKSNNWGKFRPKIVIVEVVQHCGDHGVRQNSKYDEFMAAQNYIKLADTYINAIYIEQGYAKEKQI